MEEIDPKFHSFNELLAGKLFRIPDYQRPYSWEQRQREDLFADILKVQESTAPHFMATVVCLRTDQLVRIGSDEVYVYDIVDGQQRLTTLITLLKAIQKSFDKRNNEEKEEAEKLQKEILVRGKDNLILLQTNHDQFKVFEDYLRNGTKPGKSILTTLPLKNLSKCINDCEKFVTEWRKNNDRISLLSIIKNKLNFIFYKLQSEKTVYTVFEVLNSRGLAVNYLDKTKSILMGQVFEYYKTDVQQRNQYTGIIKETWSKIYEIIGINELNDDDIVKYSATFLFDKESNKGKLLSNEEALQVFRDLSKIKISNVLDISYLMLNVAKYLKKLNETPFLKFFNSISQVRFLFISFYLNNTFGDAEKKRLIWLWEKASFRIYGLMGNNAKKRIGDYIRLGREIYHQEIVNPYDPDDEPQNYNNFENSSLINKISERLELIAETAPIDHAVKYLENEDCYNSWENEVKYFFYKYEEYLSEKKGSRLSSHTPGKWNEIFLAKPSDSIEHIFPQTPGKVWNGKLGKGTKVENIVHRLGNLVILNQNLNSQCGNKGFSDKRKIYKKALLHSLNDICYHDYITEHDLNSRKDWDKAAIEKREERLIDAAREIWK